MTTEVLVETILHERPPAQWWATLTTLLLDQKLLSASDLVGHEPSALRPALLRLFWGAVLENKVRNASYFVLNPWQTWFLAPEGARSERSSLDEYRLRVLVETGAAAFPDSPPADFAQLSAALSVPGSPPLTWVMLRTWLFSLTTVEFLQDYLDRRHVKFTDSEPRRHLWVKFCMLVRKWVNSRRDLVFLGVEDRVYALGIGQHGPAFRQWVEQADADAGLQPYTHGDPTVQRPLDVDLEQGALTGLRRLLRASAKSTDMDQVQERLSQIEKWLDDYYLVSWLSQRTQRGEADLWSLHHNVLLAMYIDLTSCSDATEYFVHHVINEREFDRMTAWLNKEQKDDKSKENDMYDIPQQYCQVEKALDDQLVQGNFAQLDRFRAALLNFARFHYVAEDPVHLSDTDLQHLANKLAERNFMGMSRALAQAVVNEVMEQRLTPKDFLDIANERSLTLTSPDLSRAQVLQSNTRRLRFFADIDDPVLLFPDGLNLARITRQLDLVWDKRLEGRELGDSLMRQYLRLASIYLPDSFYEDPVAIDKATRDFVLIYQYQ